MIKQLKKRCYQPIKSFHALGEYTPCMGGLGYTFIDRGGSVLAVAHLDTVLSSTHFVTTDKRIYSPVLDDRLGVYTILDYLTSGGVKFDVLLTEGEESAQSTAYFFETNKEYNWIFQFDRRGTQTVLYEYETPELTEILAEFKIKVGIGSYSDICELSHLNVAGFNFGTGYYREHFKDSYMIISEWRQSVNRFINFYNAYNDIKLEHTPIKAKYLFRWDDFDLPIYEECPMCSTKYYDEKNADSIYIEGFCIECLSFYNKWFARL